MDTTEEKKDNDGGLESKTKEELIEIIKKMSKEVKKKSSKKKIKDSRQFSMDKYYQRYIALKIVYFGWDYFGFASQPQEESPSIEVCFKKVFFSINMKKYTFLSKGNSS